MSIFNPSDKYDSPVELFQSRDREYPIPQDMTHYLERRYYLQKWSMFEEPDPKEPFTTDDGDTLYVVEQDVEERLGALVRFVRTYATIPADRTEPSSFAYEFPGFFNTDRIPFQLTVDAEIEYTYYIPGVTPTPQLVERQKYMRSNHPTMVLSNPSAGTLPASSPTIAQYQALINNKTRIVAEDPTRKVYLGAIVERKVIKVIAQ